MRFAIVPVLFVLCAGPAQAGLITSSSGFTSPTVVDFSQFSTTQFLKTTVPVVEVGPAGDSISFTSSNDPSGGGAFVGPNGHYSFGTSGSGNGVWNGSKSGTNMFGITGLNTTTGTITFTFNNGPVAQVGGFINYEPGLANDVYITALLVGGGTETYDITTLAPISTGPTSTNAGAFRGISDNTNDIVAFQLSNSFVGLDNLTYTRLGGSSPAAPEPSSLILGAVACAGLQAYRLARRKPRKT